MKLGIRFIVRCANPDDDFGTTYVGGARPARKPGPGVVRLSVGRRHVSSRRRAHRFGSKSAAGRHVECPDCEVVLVRVRP